MKKVLFIANSDRHIRLCHLPYMKMFQDNGYLVHVATNSLQEIPYCDKKIDLQLNRNPYHFSNFRALKKVRKLVKVEDYDIVSCHTPVGGFLGRGAFIGRRRKMKTKVFYMAHGFHFYKGSSIISWLLYYPIEKFLSRFSDAVITMNQEDYSLANKKFHCNVYKIPGIGLDLNRLVIKNKNIRKKYHLKNKYIVTCIAEVSKRKGQLEFLNQLKNYQIDRDIEFLFIGDSIVNNASSTFEKIKNVKYIGFQDHIGDYIYQSDLIISLSKQEGLPQNILEALYFHKPIIGMNIRGIRDLLQDGSGILVHDYHEMIQKILEVKHNQIILPRKNIDLYKLENTIVQVKEIYNLFLLHKLL